MMEKQQKKVKRTFLEAKKDMFQREKKMSVNAAGCEWLQDLCAGFISNRSFRVLGSEPPC